jgi:hypothetical protein
MGVMKDKIAQYLKEHRTLLENEWIAEFDAHWKSRMVADSMSCARGGVREPCQHSTECHARHELQSGFVHVFYDELIQEIEGTSHTQSPSPSFPHFTEEGTRVTLPYLMETYFAGEDVFLKHFGNAKVDPIKGQRVFEVIREGLQSLAIRESHRFCGECITPLARAIQEVITESKCCEKSCSHEHNHICSCNHG